MRIISGYFKGKKILHPKDNQTRPLRDIAKESIFNILNHSKKFDISLTESLILDMFSGVGSFGIECISRGAKHVTFVENYKGVLPILKKNLYNLKLKKNYNVINLDILKGLEFKNFKRSFNLIFLDPPYKQKNLYKILANISKEKILNKNGLIIIHRHKNDKNDYPLNLKVLEEKEYGISKILFATFE